MFAELETALKTLLTTQTNILINQARIEAKLDLLLAKRPDTTLPQDTPPTEPHSPIKTEDMVVYQPSWKDVVLQVPGTKGLTGLQWTRANQTPDEGETSVNQAEASSEIVGDVLRLRLAPTKPFDQVAARTVLNNHLTQWVALQPYANSTLHMRFEMGFLGALLPVFDMSVPGRWVTLAQWKDKPNDAALIQLNMDQNYCLWLGTRTPDTLKRTVDVRVPAFQPGKLRPIDIEYYMTNSNDGYFKLFLDETLVAELKGIAAGPMGYVSHHFAFYSNALKEPATLSVGGFIISKAPIE